MRHFNMTNKLTTLSHVIYTFVNVCDRTLLASITMLLKVTIVITFVFMPNIHGQWPLPQSFYDNMNRMRTNLETMGNNLRRQAQREAVRREAIYNENVILANNGTDFNGYGKIFVSTDGRLGYAYNSSDGSYTMYIIGTSSPPSGFMYHIGPNGNHQYRTW
ncbi:hypothetical protein ACF0H5_008966 [Mactra antiquata]